MKTALLALMLVLLLGLVFAAYLSPAFVIDAANVIAGCG